MSDLAERMVGRAGRAIAVMMDEESTELPVHPAAAVFPMLSDDELRELAEDIKQNGQIHPIMLDTSGAIVDGRNRRAACTLAGIEPWYAQLPDGADPVAFILSANVRRRQMTKGQTAMAIAMMIETQEGKRDGQTTRLTLESNVSRPHIAQALTIRRYAADLAAGVLAGTEAFEKAYEVAKARKAEQDAEREGSERKARSDTIELERLRHVAPDLAAAVPDTMTVDEAKAALAQREQRHREQRESMARVADTTCGFLDPGLRSTPAELAARIVETLDASALPHRPVFTAARFARCTETLAAITRLLEAKEASRNGHAPRS